MPGCLLGTAWVCLDLSGSAIVVPGTAQVWSAELELIQMFFKSSGRMALLVTVFLVLINIFNTITTNSPNAEGLTAIEIWMLACILFVFGMYSVFNILGIFTNTIGKCIILINAQYIKTYFFRYIY